MSVRQVCWLSPQLNRRQISSGGLGIELRASLGLCSQVAGTAVCSAGFTCPVTVLGDHLRKHLSLLSASPMPTSTEILTPGKQWNRRSLGPLGAGVEDYTWGEGEAAVLPEVPRPEAS